MTTDVDHLHHLMVPSLPDSGMAFVDLYIARTILVVVIDDATGLQMGIDRHSSHVLKPALLEVFTDPVGEAVADRDSAFVMSLVQNRFAAREAPDIITEAAVLLANTLIASSIIDHSQHFTR